MPDDGDGMPDDGGEGMPDDGGEGMPDDGDGIELCGPGCPPAGELWPPDGELGPPAGELWPPDGELGPLLEGLGALGAPWEPCWLIGGVELQAARPAARPITRSIRNILCFTAHLLRPDRRSYAIQPFLELMLC